jgi:hypothetical protein
MKNRSIKLKIDKPCHEDWNSMLPVEQGRFCNSCEKQVVDLTKMTDLEIIKYMDLNKGKSICGNARPTQLDRSIQYNAAFQNKANPNFNLRLVLMGASLSALLGMESCSTPRDGQKVGKIAVVEQPKELRGDVAMEYDHTNENLSTGTIYKDDNTALANAKISLFDANNVEVGKTTSRNDGSYRLAIDWKKEPVYMKVEQDGFLSQMMYLSYIESLQEMKITMIPGELMQKGEMRVIEEK